MKNQKKINQKKAQAKKELNKHDLAIIANKNKSFNEGRTIVK